MAVKRTIFIILGLLMLVAVGSAYYADPSSSTFLPGDSTKEWIIADLNQQNIIALVAGNSTVGPIKNAQVTFTLDTALLGTISPANAVTDDSGKALCTFTVNNTHPTSGTAKITADITSNDADTGSIYHTILVWNQKIDHNIPYTANISNANEAGVGAVLPVKISITDRWGNQIDDKKPEAAHTLTLHVNGPTPPNDCGFTDLGGLHDNQFNLDPNGEVSLSITTATKPGWHYLLMDPMGAIPEQMKLFNTVANGVPFSMTQTFDPDGDPYATVLADGTSKFTFYYTLYDKYGNPTTGQSIKIQTASLDKEETPQEFTIASLDNGQVWSSFGPKSFTNKYLVTATAVSNTTITKSKTIRFYNTTPENLEVSANPESMPSRDANPAITSDISAKVTDIMGNGVAGEEVTFVLQGITKTVDATVTNEASFSSTSSVLTASAITDEYGYATVKFYPGAFATENQPGYMQAVTGNAVITATWKTSQKDVPVTWKNYPYLSAVVAVKPAQVQVGNTVDVSIKLNGDGWALYRYPIDVDLVMDRSGSMAYTDVSPSRLAAAKSAAKTFVGNMGEARDRLGLVSFSSATSVNLDKTLQSPFAPVTKSINSLSATGATAMRPALKMAIDDLVAHPNGNSNAVRAVIVMTDGDWNNDGAPNGKGHGFPSSDTKLDNNIASWSGSETDYSTYYYYSDLSGGSYHYGSVDVPNDKPDLGSSGIHYTTEKAIYYDNAEFTNQNMSIYAKNNNIRLYIIFFAGSPDPTAETTLKTMAEATGGFYQHATSAAELDDAYTRIAGDLVTEAGVDTEAELDFGELIVNDELKEVSADPYFEYVGDPIVAAPEKDVDLPTTAPGSTMIDKYNKTPDGAINKHLVPGLDDAGFLFTDVGPIIINQTDYWKTHDQHLHFNIGTVNVNETWETNFRLKVLKEGNILIFGPKSKISFKNGEAGPSTMTLPNLSLTASMNPVNLGLSQTTIDVVGLARTDDGLVKGTLPVKWTTVYNGADTITEEVSYIRDTDPPVRFDTKTLTTTDILNSQTVSLNTDKLPSGGYKIQVRAFTKDASVTKECGPYSYTTQGRSFIKIE